MQVDFSAVLRIENACPALPNPLDAMSQMEVALYRSTLTQGGQMLED
jgi:hypothetical protein